MHSLNPAIGPFPITMPVLVYLGKQEPALSVGLDVTLYGYSTGMMQVLIPPVALTCPF